MSDPVQQCNPAALVGLFWQVTDQTEIIHIRTTDYGSGDALGEDQDAEDNLGKYSQKALTRVSADFVPSGNTLMGLIHGFKGRFQCN